MSLDELRAQALEGAEKVSEGRFRIDADRALQKLRDFRLVDPHLYVLELLRAALASGATSVNVTVDATVFEVHFDGTPIAPKTLQDLLSHALSAGDAPDGERNRLLAFGVAGAMGLRPHSVQVTSSGATLELREDGVTFQPRTAKARPGVTVRVQEKLGLRALRDAVLTPLEESLIRQHADRFPVPLTVNRKRVVAPVPNGQDTVKVKRDHGAEVTVVLPPGKGPAQSEVRFDLLGCAVVTRRLLLPLQQAQIHVRADSLRRNASGSDIVEDENFGKVMALIRAAHQEALVDWLAAAPKSDPLESVLFERLVELARERKLESLPEGLRDAVEATPLLPGPAGELVTIRALKEELRKGRGIRYSTRAQPEGTYTPPAVLLDGYRPEVRLLLPAPPRIDIQEEVEARVRGVRERRRWQREPKEEPTLRGSYVARGPLHSQRYRGELGFPLGAMESQVRVLQDARLVAQLALPKLAPLRIDAVVDVDGELPEATWSALPERLASEELHHALTEAAATVMSAALGGRTSLPAPLRDHAQSLLCALVRAGKGLQELPEGLRTAPIFETAGGSLVSLAVLSKQEELRHVPFPWPRPSLSGHQVVVVSETVREPLRRLLGRVRWIPFSDQLRAEQEVHERLAGPRRAPVLADRPLIAVPIEEEGLKGEVGIPRKFRSNLELVLLRDGLQLEIAQARTRYGGLVAVVDCPALTPEDGWQRAKRDAAMGRILTALQDAEKRLVPQILTELAGRPMNSLPRPVQSYLLSFLRKELGPGKKVEALQQTVLDAPMVPTTRGVISLAQLSAEFGARGAIPWLERPDPEFVGTDLRAMVLERDAALVVSAALGLSLERAQEELSRHRNRAAFEAQPRRKPVVAAPLPLRLALEQPHVVGEVVFAPERTLGCDATILFDGRVLDQRLIASPLPLLAALELRDRPVDPGVELPAERVEELVQAVSLAEAALVRGALKAPAEPEQRRLLLTAIRYGMDERLAAGAREALLALPLFPTLQGRLASARELLSAKRIAYVIEPLEGAPRSKDLIIVAAEAAVRSALDRFGGRLVDVTDAVRVELYARQKRAKLPQVERIAVEGSALARVPLSERGNVGELAWLGSPGYVQVFQDRRLLCHLQPTGWPDGLVAAIEAPELEPTPDHVSVIRDAAYRRVCEQLLSAADALAETVVDEFERLGPSDKARWTPGLARLAFWSAGRERKAQRLLELPLLEATDGAALSVSELQREQKAHRAVRWSRLTGLDGDERVWRPRLGETELAEALKWTLREATAELRAAAQARARRKIDSLWVESLSPWRIALEEAGLEGEVVLELPLRSTLRLELVKEKTLVEVVELESPFGGIARVQSQALGTNPAWTKVTRNQAYQKVREAVEGALQALVYRCLEKSDPLEIRPLALAALRHRLGTANDLGPLLPTLPLFFRLGGGTATIGEVLSERSAARTICVAASHLAPSGPGLVLEDIAPNRELLAVLNCRSEDISAELRRVSELERIRKTRRIEHLRYPGEALVLLEVDAEGYRGQLALPLDPEREEGVRLARDRVAVDVFQDRDGLVAGVLSHPELPVNSDWSKAVLTGAVRSFLQSRIDALFAQLMAQLPALNEGRREVAAEYALRFIAGTGVKNAAGLERLSGTAAALARQPFFRTAEGRWVDLLTLADRVRSGRPLGVVRRDLLRHGEGGDLAVVARFTSLRWVRVLSQVLGGGLRMIDDAGDWEVWTKEGDPLESTQLGKGLARLRREVRLLRADAFGQLGMKELNDVRLRPGNGKRPVDYDAKRAVALLDPENPEVRRALEEAEARPDRLFVLLLAIYGAVNRALQEVTDADEARLATALLGHLAANPGLLRPK